MPDEPPITDITLNLPPHARIVRMDFDTGPGKCRISLDDRFDQVVTGDEVRSIHGARIPHESYGLVLQRRNAVSVVVHDDIHRSMFFALAIRVRASAAIWFLIADSFNFRAALGPESANVTEKNLGLLVKRLTAFAPHAGKDAFIRAFDRSLPPLPPPVESLMEFLWIVAATP
jgi:hypothetical protein